MRAIPTDRAAARPSGRRPSPWARRRAPGTLAATTLLAVSLATGTGPATASVLVDPDFDGFAFRAPLDPGRTDVRSNGTNCPGGVAGQPGCFRFPGWYPFVQSSPGRVPGRVALDPVRGVAELALPGGGGVFGNYVSLSQSPVLERGVRYRLSATIGAGASNGNPEPYVSTFCDRPSPDGTLYQGTDVVLPGDGVPGSTPTRVTFVLAGDGERWTCSVRLLGQPGATGGENVLTTIDVLDFSLVRTGRPDVPAVPDTLSRDAGFEAIANDVSGGAWRTIARGTASPSARVERDTGDARLRLSIASGDDVTSITAWQPVALEKGGRYRLCAEIANLSGTDAIANLAVTRPLPAVPGSQGGFATGPIDVALSTGETRRIEFPFTASRSRVHRLETRALGYGNGGPVSLAFDDVGIVSAARGCDALR